MKDWTGTLTLTPQQVTKLEAFIREPDTRQSDILDQGQQSISSDLRLDWIVKHDLFEGVVLHVSLMTADGTTFLVGEEAGIREAEDILRTYTLAHQGRHYHLAVSTG